MKAQSRRHPPVHMAAIRGDLKLIKELILVEDRNEIDYFGRNAMMWAMQKGHAHVVYFLLPGTNLLAQDSREMTALQIGVHHDQASCVRVLVRAAAHLLGEDVRANAYEMATNGFHASSRYVSAIYWNSVIDRGALASEFKVRIKELDGDIPPKKGGKSKRL